MRTLQKHVFGLALASASLFVGAGVAAAEDEDENAGTGITVTAGGGVEDFAGHTMRHTSNANGIWAIHTGVEVQKYVALEAGYLGSAAKINAPLGNAAATLVGTTFEAIGRLTPLPDSALQPYGFFGAAWRHYDIAGESFTTSDAGMNDSDDLFQIPVGVGLGYRYGSLVGDARFTYRPSVGESMVIESDGEYATMNSWGLAGGVGYEF